MKWFSGTIAQAISFAQGQKATFVAYIEGRCEKSKLMTSVFNDPEITSNLECNRFVCVKLEADSIGHRQLSEIYKSAPVPFLFYISHSGIPLDIVCGDLLEDKAELKETILDATIKCNELNASQGKLKVPQSLEERRLLIDEILENRKKERAARKVTTKPKEESKDEGIKAAEANESIKPQVKEDAELKKMAEERAREKAEEALAKQRILDQIAQDKVERAARAKPVNTIPKKDVQNNPPSRASPNTNARIQFRLPTGESKSEMFPNETKLSQIRDHIDQNFQLPYRDYKLAMTFPRREFTPEDCGSTLTDLNLTPTAVLLILPKSGSGVRPYSRSWLTFVTDMVNDFLQPVYSLSNYVYGLIFRTRSDQGPPPSETSQPSPHPRAQQGQTRTYVRKSGNIHSLRDLRDGNDENNTWNGNSTQQM